MGAGEAEHTQAYFKHFFVLYSGLAKYQKSLMDGVIRNGIVQTPSGRQYHWPNAKRYGNGRISNATQVVNYPVQGFGNDLVQMACVRAYRRFKELDLKSLLILTVHDSIVVDTHPDEIDLVHDALTWAMTGVLKEAETKWNYDFPLPLAIEIETGQTWLI
jgi:DNA polymerase-1